jgi:hypothetical protein
MRRLILITILAAVAFAVLPLSKSVAIVCEECAPPPPAPHHSTSSTHSSSHVGSWIVACGIASAGSLIIGSIVQANDRNDPRQLTINEVAWHSAVCPLFLPLALLVQSTCPDNNATYQVARLAFRFLRRHPVGDQSPFTNAYAEACHTGRLSSATRAFLRSLI